MADVRTDRLLVTKTNRRTGKQSIYGKDMPRPAYSPVGLVILSSLIKSDRIARASHSAMLATLISISVPQIHIPVPDIIAIPEMS